LVTVTIKFASQICQIAGVTVPTQASCAATGAATTSGAAPSGSAAPATTSAGSAAAGSSTRASSSVVAQTTNGAAIYNAGNTLGMGMAVAGVLAML